MLPRAHNNQWYLYFPPSILVLNSSSRFSQHFNPLNIVVPFSSTSASLHSFVPSASHLWNSLPHSTILFLLLLLLSFVLCTIPLSFKYLISLQNITATYYYNLLLLILATVLLSIFLLKKIACCPKSSMFTSVRATTSYTSVRHVALAVLFSGFHSGHHLICCTDRTVILKSSLLWAAWSTLDSVLLATVVKVSISRL